MNDIITLIPTNETMERGNMIRAPVYERARQVFAKAYSVGMREYYEATAAGLELAAKFELWAHEYRGELMLSWQGREYGVERVYKRGADRVELGCSLRAERNGNGIN